MNNGQNSRLPAELMELGLHLQRLTMSQENDPDHAAVALVLCGPLNGLELVMIKRSRREGDPWSGHLALPGGRPATQDLGHRHTAMRETREEVAIDLEHCHYLGALSAILPRWRQHRGPLVFPYLFWHEQALEAIPNPDEVDSAFRLELRQFFTPEAFGLRQFTLANGESVSLPSMQLPQGVLWGLTYAILIQFIETMLQTPLGRHYWQETQAPSWWRGP